MRIIKMSCIFWNEEVKPTQSVTRHTVTTGQVRNTGIILDSASVAMDPSNCIDPSVLHKAVTRFVTVPRVDSLRPSHQRRPG